jgi:Glycosyl hydrolase family 12
MLTAGTNDAGGGYFSSGDWHGYAWTSTSGTGSTINPTDFSAVTAGQPFCVSGSVAGLSDYSGTALLGVNVNQAEMPGAAIGTATPALDGVTISLTNSGQSALRLQIQGPTGDTDPNDRWCANVTGTGGFIPWSSFNTQCWASGTPYDGESPIASVSLLVPGAATGSTSFSFCLDALAETTTSGVAAGGGGADAGSGSGSGGTSDASGSGANLNIDAGAGVLTGTGTLTTQYQWAAVTRDGRNYVVQNNVWGGTSNQAVSYDGTTFSITQQNGSNATNGAPISFPSVFIGSNNSRSTSGSNLPHGVSTLSSVPTTWTNNAGGPSGTYDAAYDVWFSTGSGGDPGSPSGGYLMVWYYKPTNAQPIGSVKYSAVTIPNASGTWDVWIGDNGNVPCISYVRTQSIQSMSYDLNSFIQDAVKNRPGTIQSGWYLTNVFAGFEIWSGGQGLQTTSFSAVVN